MMKKKCAVIACVSFLLVFVCSCSSLKSKGAGASSAVPPSVPDSASTVPSAGGADSQTASADPTTAGASVSPVAANGFGAPGTASNTAAQGASRISSATFVAVGDNLIHETIYRQASARDANGGYDFAPAYMNVLPYMAFADFSFINQETLILPEPYKPSTYPRFCSPAALGDFLVSSGFNMISLANNHMLDKDERGLIDTLEYWDSKTDIVVSGVFRNQEDLDTVRLLTRGDITLSFVAAATTLNGLSLPKNSQLKILHTTDEAELEKQIRAARAKSDAVVVSVHWGNEYETKPTAQQKALAQKMADWGADIILGSHPHVLQPIEELSAKDGRKTLVMYSLGNFISSQNEGERLIGALLSLRLEKDSATGSTVYRDVSVVPLITHYGAGFSNITVYPLSMYTPDLARSHGVRKQTADFNYNYVLNTAKNIIGADYLKLPKNIVAQSSRRYELWVAR